jgi:hypothetical protein
MAIADPKTFIKAGKAFFTIKSKKTDARFTFKVTKCDEKDIWFVSVLTGSCNETDYSYMGCIFGDDFRLTKKSRFNEDCLSYKAFNWMWNMLKSGNIPESMEFYHEGRCGRCGRKLTVPESIESGFGPECIHMV